MNRQTKSFFTTSFPLLNSCLILLVFSLFENCTNSPKQNKIVQNKIAQDTSAAIKYADSLFMFIGSSNNFEKNINILDTALKIRKNIYEINPSQENHIKIARTYYGLGYNYNSISSYLTAKKHYQSALDIINLCKDSARIFAYAVALAGPKNQCGEFLETELLIENAFKAIKFTKKSDSLHLFLIALQRQSEIADYKKNYNDVFSIDSTIYYISSKNKNRDKDVEAIYQNSILNLGIDYRIKKQYTSAFSFLERAKSVFLQLAKKEGEQNYVTDIANANTEVANTHFALKNYQQAIRNYQNSLKILEKEGFSSHPYATEAQLGISNCLFEQKKYREAFGAAEKAMKILVPDDSIQHAHAPQHYLLATMAKVKCHKALNPNDLQSLLKDYEYADALIAYIHQHHTHDKSKLDLTEQSLPFYEDAINTAVALYTQTSQTIYLDKALHFYERNKAVILREALQENAAKEEAGISKDLLQKERYLKIELAYSQKKILDAANDSLKNVWKHNVFNLQSDIDKFNRELADSNPNYYRLRYESKKSSLTTSEIQQNLDDKTLFLEYFIGEKNIYTFAISKTGIKSYVTEKPQHFSSDFLAFREAISKANSVDSAYLKQSYALYQLLVEAPLRDLNAAQNIKTLRIVPDAELGYLPFDCLTEQPASGWKNADNPKWLLYKYASSYLYSNTLLANKNKKTQGENIGFGLNYKEQPSFEQLENAPNEVQSFTSLLGGKSFLNAKATLACFLAEAPKAKILHLAMHGILDEKNPLNSALIFAESAQQDSLFASQIYNMQLQSGLVVLSACNTGYGKIQRGEGVMSLARAFAFAGCPSTAVSLWSIPNKSTSEIMEQFYANIKAGKPKDEALQLAKLHYLEHSTSPQKTIPNLWAASVLIGDTNPLENQYNYWWILLGIAVFIGVLKLFKARN